MKIQIFGYRSVATINSIPLTLEKSAFYYLTRKVREPGTTIAIAGKLGVRVDNQIRSEHRPVRIYFDLNSLGLRTHPSTW